MQQGIQKRTKNQQGFTLIETVVVAGLSLIIMLSVSSMFIVFMVNSAKTSQAQKIKNEGNNTLSKMEYLIRNAKEVTSDCSGVSQGTLSIVDYDDATTTYGVQSSKIASESAYKAISKTYPLTSDSHTVDSLSFTCYPGYNNSQYVEINFALKYGPGTTADSKTVFEEFSTGVVVRN